MGPKSPRRLVVVAAGERLVGSRAVEGRRAHLAVGAVVHLRHWCANTSWNSPSLVRKTALLCPRRLEQVDERVAVGRASRYRRELARSAGSAVSSKAQKRSPERFGERPASSRDVDHGGVGGGPRRAAPIAWRSRGPLPLGAAPRR